MHIVPGTMCSTEDYMNELTDENIRLANEAYLFLESQIKRLHSVVSCTEAESIMQEVSNYEFPQINCYMLFDTPLVRCVKIDKEKDSLSSITQMERFSFPPICCVQNPGRMNIPGVPTFYAANEIKTSLLESDISEGDEFYAGIWAMDDNASMLSYPCIPYNMLCELSARGDAKALEMKNCVDRFPCIRKMTVLIGKVFSIPHEENTSAENKYIYYLSGAIAHSILNQKKVTNNGIYQTDAIIYPSVKMLGSTYNLAIRPKFVNQHMKLLYVVKGKLNEGQIKYSFDYVGFNENDTIIWKQMRKRVKGLKITKISDESGIHSPLPNENICFEGKNYTIAMFESYAYGQLNNQNSPLKEIKSDQNDNIDIMDPTWVRKWEEDTEHYLVLACANNVEVQMKATINSYFSTDGVEPEMVFGYKRYVQNESILYIVEVCAHHHSQFRLVIAI